MEIWRVDDTTLDVWHGKVIVAMWMHLRIITHTCTNGRKNCVRANKSPFSEKNETILSGLAIFPRNKTYYSGREKNVSINAKTEQWALLLLLFSALTILLLFLSFFVKNDFFPCFVWFLFLESASRCLSTSFVFLILFAFSRSLISLSRKSKMCLSNFYWCTNEIDTFKRFLLS